MQFYTKYATKLKMSKYAFILCPIKTFPFSPECLESSLNQSENGNNPIAENITCHRNPLLNNNIFLIRFKLFLSDSRNATKNYMINVTIIFRVIQIHFF